MGVSDDMKSEMPSRSLVSAERQHRKTLIGTAGTWFFFDISYYGTAIFAPTIMAEIFETGAPFEGAVPLSTIALRAALLPFCGIIGTIVGISSLRCLGPQILNCAGLLITAVLYFAFVCVMTMLSDCPWQGDIQFGIVCAIFFVLMGGPNIATYVLPVMSFPKSIRSTYHGWSGSAGKFGALLGTFIFPIIRTQMGLESVFVVQAVAC